MVMKEREMVGTPEGKKIFLSFHGHPRTFFQTWLENCFFF